MTWYKNNKNDIAISTRVRLARNLDSTPFPAALKDKKSVIDKIRSAAEHSLSGMKFIDLNTVSENDRLIMAQQHLISPDMINGRDQAVIISEDELVSCLVMEEDHLRIQAILPGFDVDGAYKTANMADDCFEETLKYAFDEEFGYLTACPTNVGTGMRVSVMMHLPALTLSDQIGRIINSVSRMGITVRGLYGEGSKAYGNLYQVSNQTTIGMTDEEICEKVKEVAARVEAAEREAEKQLEQGSHDALADKVWRSFGLLKYAKRMSSAEAKTLLSDVLFGKRLGIIDEDIDCIRLMVETESGMVGGDDPDKRDLSRAEMLNKILK